ncbi:TetR/AcrR family transcriptional regulator [Streptomyces scabiei]|uniref:TetR/AcrR family transcriptional regulator n=1 Tax=Streptomyces scabiei TaxID=1930 RepID=UPI000765A153|nr:TetR family transcriptional regulator [Streptomyces scabiei]
MARYSKEHKHETRQRIIEAASRRFKQDGVDGSGIATLMADAGLTNGAFYAHFESKDDLVAHVIADELGRQADVLATMPQTRASLREFVREYLSPEHRDAPAVGCPSAALLDEIVRCAGPTKQAYTEAVERILDEMAARMAPRDPASGRSKALGLYTMLVGTLQLGRAVSDPKLSGEVLESGIKNAELLLR